MHEWAYQECTAFYHPYLKALKADGDIRDILLAQMAELQNLLRNLDEEQAGYRYSPDKWSIRQCLGHMIDSERVFSFRAMCFARGDAGPFPGMDQDSYVNNADFENRKLAEMQSEYRFLRQSTVLLFGGFTPQAGKRRGVAFDCEFTARVLAYIIAGHERHHINILKERYLAK